MNKKERKVSAEIEARWKEFWDDHKDYEPDWVRDFLMELNEDLPYVFGPSTREALLLAYVRCGVPREAAVVGPGDDRIAPDGLPVRELFKLPIGQFALAVRAYAYYGLMMPDWLDRPEYNLDEYLDLFGRGFFSGGYFSKSNDELYERHGEDETQDRLSVTIRAAEGRWTLDHAVERASNQTHGEGNGLTPEWLAALARVSRKSIMNLLAPGSGGVLQSDSENRITPESARRWLMGRPDFRPSIWQQQEGKSFWRPWPEPSSIIEEPLFVPVARDGSWFSPTDQHKRDGQYYVSNGSDEEKFNDYGPALEFLTRATLPRWRYTDTLGRWRSRTAVGWERKRREEVMSVNAEAKQEPTKRIGRKA
jgi:hypothetical protein